VSTARPPLLRLLVEAALLGAVALDALLGGSPWGSAWSWAVAALAVLGVLLRRRWPVLAFAATLPGFVTSFALIATLVTLYEVARTSPHRRRAVAAAVVTVLAYVVQNVTQIGAEDPREVLLQVVYAVLTGAAPVAMGQLVRVREALRRQLVELDEAHRTEQDLREQQVLERERSRLAREMHDVVSHQVSLVAVQAGALQVSTREEVSREAARTIRGLAVSTLDELRHMVEVLRAQSPGGSSLQPQPGLDDLAAMVEASGLDVDLQLEPDLPLDQHAQRAVYRTVQEGLTNVRKHAPGSRVEVVLEREDDGGVVTRVRNGPGTERPLGLPSAGLGLVGLRERADLAEGRLDAAATADGGFELALHLPASSRRP
jgi:signal transduction histidine kinase